MGFWGRLGSRLSWGFDRTSAATGVTAGLGMGALLGMTLATNPIGWAIGGGLLTAGLVTAGMSYARGPRNFRRAFNRWGGLHSDSDENSEDDDNWSPRDNYRRSRARAGGRSSYPLESLARQWDGTGYHQTSTGAGTVSYRRGYGGHPFIQSRKDDYNGARVGLEYRDFVPHFEDSDPEKEEDNADTLLRMSHGEQPDLSDWSDEKKRAAAHFLGVTQIAEEHRSRNPVSAGLARSGLRTVADGHGRMRNIFTGQSASYLPARKGGTGLMRDSIAADDDLDEDLMGNLSEPESGSDGDDDDD